METAHEADICCVCNIDNDNFATGSVNGHVHIYNLKSKKDTARLKCNGATPVRAIARIRAYEKDVIIINNLESSLFDTSMLYL